MLHHKKILSALLAVLSTAALTVPALPAFSASAELVTVQVGLRGDVNQDEAVNVQDAVLLSRYLLGSEAIPENNPLEYADLNRNGALEGTDLTILKRLLLTGAEPEGIYEEIEVPDDTPELIDPPIAAVNPTMPSVGEARVLMFAVSFPDCAHSEGYTTDEIWEMSFGPEDTSSKAYPLESISAYYTRASYGRLTMEGDVYQYTAANNIDTYINNTDKLLEEIMAAFDDEIDYSKYDVNNDGTMDTVLVALPGDAAGRDGNNDGSEDWWPCSGGYYGRKKFDGVKAGNLCIGAWALSDRGGFNSTWIHELGHAMGLPDYYKYENTQDGYYGLNGYAGYEMMDDAFGDMCAFSKLMYGWYTTEEVQVYTGGTQTFTLSSSQSAPNCVLIPRGDLNDYYSEYFMIESITATGNNAGMVFGTQRYPLFSGNGLRIMHCDAELAYDGYWGTELKWNNYGRYYDNSNQKQRVLRLINDGADSWITGTVNKQLYSDFAWYDDNGDRTIDSGLTITINSISTDGTCIFTVSDS